MPLCRSLLLLLVCAALAPAADVSLLKGGALKGDVVGLTEKELILEAGGERKTYPLIEILKIDLGEVSKPGSSATYANVELVDGTVLHCSKYAIKKANIELTLLSGPSLTLPLSLVANVLNNAHVEKNRKDWVGRVTAKRTSDLMVREVEGTLGSFPCTIGEGDDKGETIELTAEVGGEVKTFKLTMAKLQGLIFRRTLDPKAPPLACKLLDTTEDVVMVSGVVLSEKTLKVTTQAGAKLEFPLTQVARLDFTKGRFEYLSDVEPVALTTRSNVEDGGNPMQQHVYKDVSFKTERKGGMQIGSVTYPKGLIIRPYTEMTFNLNGDYSDFSAVVGLEDGVGSDGPVVLEIHPDGGKPEVITLLPTDKKRFRELRLNMKDVLRLRIVVRSDDLFDLGKHVVLADAKITKAAKDK